MRQIYTPIRIVVILAGFAAMLYALYVRLSAPDPLGLFGNFEAGAVVTVLAIAAVVALAFPVRRRPQAAVGREVSGAPSPQVQIGGLLAFGALVTLVVTLTFYRYVTMSRLPAKVPGIDVYGPILPYAVSGVMVLIWLGDSLFGRIVTGTATGQSPVAQRFLLIGKRIGVAALIAGFLILFHIQMTQLYSDPRAQWALAVGFATLSSVCLIPRLPAFTPNADGSARLSNM